MSDERFKALCGMLDKSANWEVVMYHLKVTPEESREFAERLDCEARRVRRGIGAYTGVAENRRIAIA
jgi:hypothetical protein